MLKRFAFRHYAAILGEMQHGTVAILDALGFKGVWKRKDVESNEEVFVQHLKALETRAKEIAKQQSAGGETFLRTHVSFLSDTIAVALESGVTPSMTPAEQDRRIDLTVVNCALFVTILIQLAAEPPLQLAFRGSIAVGSFILDQTFLLGPAIDEAATYHEMAEGALVFLAPSALQAIEGAGKVTRSNYQSVLEWRVPLRGGRSVDTRAVSPFLNGEREEKRRSIRKDILNSFNRGTDQPDVWMKQQNTERFLLHADELIASGVGAKG